ncbi:MAG TPA: hypothetical protein RMH99_05235 [Sandaracinaceae bacterium LLY-WYZ-13_1]|nr:hypothetical protein [Sandaracinaceae bacterium LLY-WYZ-13_1]
MGRARLAALLALALATGCDDRERPPPAPGRDGSADGMDARVPWPDGRPPRRDAGPPGPALDGVVDEEWDDARCAAAEVETDRPGSTLQRLCVQIDEGILFVAVEGTLAEDDALTVYLDRALGEPDGVGDLSTLEDEDGSLDARLGGPLETPAPFAADVAWGTTRMPRTAVGLDAAAGWRTLDDPTEVTWLPAEEAAVVCSESGCEASIPLATLGGEAPRTLALFARIVAPDGSLANQTLPEDDPDDPATVSALLTLDDGEPPPPDAGAPDAGADGGVDGIVVDGVIGADEWAGAATASSTQPAAGLFAGNTLRTLHVVRTTARLFVAIEGTLTPGNAYLMYVDRDLAGPDGLTSPTPLADFTGPLDRALSKEIFTGAEVRIDHAWGTLDLGRSASGFDDRMGWRDVGFDPSAFTAVDAVTACGAGGSCETSVALRDLGVAAGDTIALFVRLGDADSVTLSNQTLPMDDPALPEFANVILEVLPP